MAEKYLLDNCDPRAVAVELASIEFAWSRPDSLIIDKPDWFQVSTPSSNEFYLNGVAFCAVEGDQGEKRVRDTIQEFRQRGVQFRWILGPSSRPSHLASFLLSEGLELTHECFGMVRSTDTASFRSVDPSITVERVGMTQIEDYAQTCTLGWGNPESMKQAIVKDMQRSIANDDDRIQYFLARVNGTPAGTGILCLSGSSGYLKGTSVVPSERNKGVYRALLQYRLSILNRMAIPLATVQTISDTSAPICRKFGFEQVCTIYQYVGT
jgi:hypothetical protein